MHRGFTYDADHRQSLRLCEQLDSRTDADLRRALDLAARSTTSAAKMALPCYRTISSRNNRVTFVTARGPIQGLNGAITPTPANHRIVCARIRGEAAEDRRARRSSGGAWQETAAHKNSSLTKSALATTAGLVITDPARRRSPLPRR